MPPVRIGKVVFHDWISIEYPPAGWTDTFIFKMPYDAGLHPDAYATLVRGLILTLVRLNSAASIWVQVAAPGSWYENEVRRVLHGVRAAVAVNDGTYLPKVDDFTLPPWTSRVPLPGIEALPAADEWNSGLNDRALDCLRVLAGLTNAYTADVASISGMTIKWSRKMLQELCDSGYARYIAAKFIPAKPKQERFIGDVVVARAKPDAKKQYPYYQITRAGLSLALRSWGAYPGFFFPEREEFRGPPDGKHRRKVRRWIAWVKKAWATSAEIWCGWPEVKIEDLIVTPDALAWGRLYGRETLFWAEVEGAGFSRTEIQEKIGRRFERAILYARRMNMHLAFVVLAMPWIQEATRPVFTGVPPNIAVVTSDWNKFGELPVPEWGKVKMGSELMK